MSAEPRCQLLETSWQSWPQFPPPVPRQPSLWAYGPSPPAYLQIWSTLSTAYDLARILSLGVFHSFPSVVLMATPPLTNIVAGPRKAGARGESHAAGDARSFGCMTYIHFVPRLHTTDCKPDVKPRITRARTRGGVNADVAYTQVVRAFGRTGIRRPRRRRRSIPASG